MIKFLPVESQWGAAAYAAHEEFTASNNAVLPRLKEDFLALVNQGFVWAATEDEGPAIGLAYSAYSPERREWETGGLMVLGPGRGKGVGTILMILALGAVLIAEDPLAEFPPSSIVAHVLKHNPLPRRIIQNALKYRFSQTVRIPPEVVPGLPVEADGMVHGDEFHLTVPETLLALAEFCANWRGELHGGTEAEIQLPENYSLELWEAIFRDMASRQAFQPKMINPAPLRTAREQ